MDYLKKLAIYESSLTDEQRALIQKTREEKKTADQKKMLKHKIRDSGRPKRPIHAFQLFFVEMSKGHPHTKVGEVVKEAKGMWDKLSDNEKSVYIKQAAKNAEKYKYITYLIVS